MIDRYLSRHEDGEIQGRWLNACLSSLPFRGEVSTGVRVHVVQMRAERRQGRGLDGGWSVGVAQHGVERAGEVVGVVAAVVVFTHGHQAGQR